MTVGIGDEQIARMSKTIFRFCLSRTGSYHDAEDLAQEILFIACRRTNHFDDEKAFYAFVWRTAGNILRSWYRGRRRQRDEELDEDLADRRYDESEALARDHEQVSMILRELARLSADYRRVMVGFYIDGRSIRELAARFSLSKSMVKYLLFQSRKRIREGINVENFLGRLSYDPVDLTLFFWGGRCPYIEIFEGNRLRQNIVMACYYDKMTEEQLSLQLGVPAAYLEDDLKKLLDYDLLEKRGMAYRSNIVIITDREKQAIDRHNEADLSSHAEVVKLFVDGYMDELRALGFYGSGMPANSLKWMLVSLILRRAYIDMLQSEVTLDYPTDCFGNACFRFLVELDKNDPYFMGVSAHTAKNGTIFLWDVPVNGEMIHPIVDAVRANMLSSLLYEQPASENDRLICSELLELGLARREGEEILPNFPCLDAPQSVALRDRITPMARRICDNAKDRIDGISAIMREHAPDHLADYARRLPALFQMEEAASIMQMLCESGWLIPLKDGMLATTVLMKNT